MSTIESGLSRTTMLCWLFGSWLVANGLTHLLVWFTTGRIYYQLPPKEMLAAEASIDLLNFVIPLLVMRWIFREESIVEATGWRWTGVRVVYWALAGFLFFLAVSLLANHAFRNQIIIYAPVGAGPLTQTDLRIMAIMLLLLPAAGEEMMFRGFLQGYCTRLYGSVVGLLVPAVLFAARHHPSDIYFGRLQHASAAAWANRFVQLYLGALMLGFVRLKARSTWASWLVHTGTIALILVIGQLWKAFVP
jgi:membrane protease YdiL (CAAX protease family)